MKYLIVIYFLIVTFLYGCADVKRPEPTKDVTYTSAYYTAMFHGDTSFTPRERTMIEEALFRWRSQTSGLIQPYVVWDLDFNSVISLKEHISDNVIIRWSSDMELVSDANKECHCRLLGYSPGRIIPNPAGPARVHLVTDTMVEVNDIHPELEPFIDVTMHEFGHVFGLQHVDDDDALMRSGYIGGKACLSKEDLTEFCRVNECGKVELRPCNRWE